MNRWILVWMLFSVATAVGTCFYVDRRATQTEFYVTRMVVDAVQGFPEWRNHIRKHPEDLGYH